MFDVWIFGFLEGLGPASRPARILLLGIFFQNSFQGVVAVLIGAAGAGLVTQNSRFGVLRFAFRVLRLGFKTRFENLGFEMRFGMRFGLFSRGDFAFWF